MEPDLVKGLVLSGPPAVEALSLDKDPEAIEKVPSGGGRCRRAFQRVFYID